MSKEKKQSNKFLSWDVWTITALALVIFGVFAVLFPWNILHGREPIPGFKLDTKVYSDLATFITGVSTPLFGLGTVILLVRTYTLQKQQLQEANEGMADQMNLLRKQRFDDNFFRLLENHHRIVEAMDLHKDSGSGPKAIISLKRDCFRTFYFHMKTEIEKKKKTKTVQKKGIIISDVNDIYDETQDYYKADLHHYFRFIYHILKYVKNSDEIEYNEKYKYTCILRATLSPYELVLIFYNCLHEFGDSHFRPLVEEFSFLKNLDKDLLFLKSQGKAYDDLAFARSEHRPVLLKEWLIKQENKLKENASTS